MTWIPWIKKEKAPTKNEYVQVYDLILLAWASVWLYYENYPQIERLKQLLIYWSPCNISIEQGENKCQGQRAINGVP